MATHSSVLAWRIPGMGEPGGLLSLGSHRVRHDCSDLAAAAETFFRKGNGTPTPVLLPGKSMVGGAWWAAVHGVAAARAETFLIEKTQGSAIGIQWVEAKHAAELLKRD